MTPDEAICFLGVWSSWLKDHREGKGQAALERGEELQAPSP